MRIDTLYATKVLFFSYIASVKFNVKIFKYLLVVIIFFFGCDPKSGTPPRRSSKDSSISTSTKSVDSSLFARKDSILIGFPGSDSVTYSRGEFNDIVVHFPELYGLPTVDPDIAYYGSVFSGKIGIGVRFNCEVGQDEFYALYAFFLRNRDTGQRLAGSRDTLIRIFEEINDIFGQLNHGGTFFGHQAYRILGYTEYRIYLLSRNTDDFRKEYSITSQKANFTNQLRQQIVDEIGVDNLLLGKHEKEDKRQDMLKSVRKINDWICNYFYLKETRQFMYDYYDVY